MGIPLEKFLRPDPPKWLQESKPGFIRRRTFDPTNADMPNPYKDFPALPDSLPGYQWEAQYRDNITRYEAKQQDFQVTPAARTPKPPVIKPPEREVEGEPHHPYFPPDADMTEVEEALEKLRNGGLDV